MTPETLSEGISRLVSVNPLFSEKNLKVIVIANEKAGGFTQVKQSQKNAGILAAALERAASKQAVTKNTESRLIITEGQGHAIQLVADIAESALSDKDSFYLIVTAGGDGTSSEVQNGLFKFAHESEEKKNLVMNRMAVLRLPIGTGNDGTDGHTFSEAVELLEESLHFANARAIKMSVAGNPTKEQIAEAGKDPAEYGDTETPAPWYAFNVAGIGLDAFVCWKANIMKAKHPGDSYKLMLDFATLNYNKTFPPEDAVLKIYKDDELLESVNTSFEILVFGVSGHRMFGGGKQILPEENNIAYVKKLDVMTMVMNSRKFEDGSYTSTNLASCFKGNRITVEYAHPILCEMDGETHLLLKENFPVSLELTDPCVQVIESDSLIYDKGTVRK